MRLEPPRHKLTGGLLGSENGFKGRRFSYWVFNCILVSHTGVPTFPHNFQLDALQGITSLVEWFVCEKNIRAGPGHGNWPKGNNIIFMPCMFYEDGLVVDTVQLWNPGGLLWVGCISEKCIKYQVNGLHLQVILCRGVQEVICLMHERGGRIIWLLDMEAL